MNNKDIEEQENDLHSLSDKVKDLKKNILMLKIKKAFEDFKDTSEFKKHKKQIARLMTKISYLKSLENNNKENKEITL